MDNQVTPISPLMVDDKVDARKLHTALGSKQDFSTWIKSRIAKYGFEESEDFTLHKFVERGTTLIDYHISQDMAKELSMLENNETGRKFRKYFIEAEKKAKELAKPKRIAPFTLAPVTDYVLYNGHKLDIIEYDGAKWFYQTALLKALNIAHRHPRTFEMYGVTTKYGIRRIILIDSLQLIADSPSQSKEVMNLRLFLRDMQPDGTQAIETHRNADTDKLLKLAKIAKKDGLKSVCTDLISGALDTV